MNDRRWAHLLERTARDARYDQLTTDELSEPWDSWFRSLPADGRALGDGEPQAATLRETHLPAASSESCDRASPSPSALSVTPDNPAAPPLPFPGAAGLPLREDSV